MKPVCRVIEAGTVSYTDAFARQKSDVSRVQAGGEETFYLLEHPHVITIGRNATGEAILVDRRLIEKRGGEVVDTDRGGDVTYHGPGQIVGYPILRLEPPHRDIRRYVHDIETMLILALADFGVEANRHPEHRGVWVDERKIASVGIRVSRWVTCHGFALNVNTDLSWFGLMNPCGIAGCTMTSIAAETGSAVEPATVSDRIVEHFARVFQRRVVRAPAPEHTEGNSRVESNR